MYNLNVSGPPLLGVDGVCTNQTPRTPEILNSLIAMVSRNHFRHRLHTLRMFNINGKSNFFFSVFRQIH